MHLRAGRAIERPGRERLQHGVRRTLLDPSPHPREPTVRLTVVRVVCGDGKATAPAFQERVPVHGGQAAARLQLAAGVVDLDPRHAVGE